MALIDRLNEVLKDRTLARDQEDELVRIVEKASRLYHPDGEQHGKPTEAYWQDQIAGFERIARRLKDRFPGRPESWYYRGPEATDEEREQAFSAVAATNPHWDGGAADGIDIQEVR